MEKFQKYNVINYSTTIVGAAGPGRAMGAAWAPRHLSVLETQVLLLGAVLP